MFKYILDSAGNINWMAIFSLLTFMFIFSLGVWLVFKKDKKTIDYVANIPLHDDIDESGNTDI
ncbi:MAG TPA: hypothetical protein P5235_12200 [Saprospiraceae bacterium]|nr:hypothetical protein [Saprospiraceae bacterium]MCB9329137.1 CcoQ/FixQ family Cbb3-type cytochrome c oxidase assembly chaperone [Lewinellaceae bacterium]HPK10092.1 hypothetical protein [Saprospiraceae bacterium]HRX30144.1 hypothetical protein [Saprospiraceae bacterium]